MQKFILSKRFLILLTVIALGTLIFSILSSTSKLATLPKAINSIPKPDAKNSDVFSSVFIQYDKDVLVDDLSVVSTPSEDWSLKQTNKTSIEISHKLALHPSTKYELIVSWKSRPLVPLIFTTQASQGDPRLVQTLTEELNRDYPLSKQTPYTNDAYYVVYSAPMTLEITIKNENILPEKAFSEIRAWVTSVGGDADAHKYVINDEPLPSAAPTITTTPPKAASPSPTPFNWDTLEDDGT